MELLQFPFSKYWPGEVDVTLLQVANEMAFIANKGWYYIPHVVDSIAGGDTYGMLDKYKVKNKPLILLIAFMKRYMMVCKVWWMVAPV